MKYILFAIGLYVLYQFIFRLLLPIYMATRKIKKGFRKMQERMQQQSRQSSAPQQEPSPKSTTSKSKLGEYIEFEEVR